MASGHLELLRAERTTTASAIRTWPAGVVVPAGATGCAESYPVKARVVIETTDAGASLAVAWPFAGRPIRHHAVRCLPWAVLSTTFVQPVMVTLLDLELTTVASRSVWRSVRSGTMVRAVRLRRAV